MLLVGATGATAQAQEHPGLPPRSLYDSRLSAPVAPRAVKPASAVELTLVARYAFAPAFMRALVRVAPHPDNRTLRIELDSPAFFRSSDVELEGDRAAQNHFFSWRSLPPGSYEAIVTVLGPAGPRAERRLPFEVLSAASGPEEAPAISSRRRR